MVLCRQCSHTTRLTMLNCPRCGYSLPYWRSRRWRMRYNGGGVTLGKKCPRCGQLTRRGRTPTLLRPLRVLSGHRCSYRTCNCGWTGAAFHAPTTRQPAT